MPLRPVESLRLYQQVAQQVRDLIRAGEYSAGNRLPPERDLAKRLGVSRPTVREAMIALEIDGLVEIRVGAGIFVSKQAPRQVKALVPSVDTGPSPFDLLAARRVVECETAAQAALHATPADIAAIGQTITAMERDLRAGGSGQQADRLFHIRIAAATRNSVLVTIVDGLWDGMFAPIFHGLSTYTGLSGTTPTTFADHTAVYEGLRRHDPDAARAAMARHLANVERALTRAADLSLPAQSKRRRIKRAS